MEERVKTGHSSRDTENLWSKYYRAIVTIVAFVLTAAGCAGIFWLSLQEYGKSELLYHVLRDISVAAIVSGVVSIAYEYILRNSFTQETKRQLAEVFEERYEGSESLRKAGITSIYTELPANIADEFQHAQHIRILQTWTGAFHDNSSIRRAFEAAALHRDVDIKILLLGPDLNFTMLHLLWLYTGTTTRTLWASIGNGSTLKEVPSSWFIVNSIAKRQPGKNRIPRVRIFRELSMSIGMFCGMRNQ